MPESNPQTRLIDAFHERTQRCLGDNLLRMGRPSRGGCRHDRSAWSRASHLLREVRCLTSRGRQIDPSAVGAVGLWRRTGVRGGTSTPARSRAASSQRLLRASRDGADSIRPVRRTRDALMQGRSEVRAHEMSRAAFPHLSQTCWCGVCDNEAAALLPEGDFRRIMRRMNLCPDCGDKRCPRADSHQSPCVTPARIQP